MSLTQHLSSKHILHITEAYFTYFYGRFKDQAVYIDRPPPDTTQPPPQPVPLQHKTLKEMNDMTPYRFPVCITLYRS